VEKGSPDEKGGAAMADFGVFIGFGFPATGREEGAIKVFQELLSLLGSQQQQGKIENFEPVFLQPHGGELDGFVLVRGQRDKLDAMVASPDFQKNMIRAQAISGHVGVVNAVLGGELQNQMSSFLSDIQDLRR
jgi:hypothetical protein